MTRPSRMRIPEGVVFEVIEDQAVLLELASGTYFSLNRTGTVAWRLIEELGELDLVKKAMIQRYPATAGEKIEQDLDCLVTDLTGRGLLSKDAIA